MSGLKWFLIVGVLAYGGLAGLMYFAQRSLMYFPDTARRPPAAAGLPQAEEVELATTDGERLVAWHIPPAGDKPVVLYFQGNGGGLDLRARRFAQLAAEGFGVLALGYRGYGGSTGRPTEQGLLKDADAAYRFAASRHAPERNWSSIKRRTGRYQ